MFPDTLAPRADRRWRGLFLLAGAGAALTAALIPLQVLVFIAWPPPASHSVAAWFDLFNDSPLLGLVSLDLLMMLEQVLLIPLVIALWLLVHRSSESGALVGLALWLGGGLLILSSNTGLEMLSLARGYAAAPEAARVGYLAAGQVMLATYWDMGTAFAFGYVMASLAGILVGSAMVRARLFGRLPGSLLAGANVIGLGIFVPGPGLVLALVSVLILWGWYVRTAWGLLRLARRIPAAGAARPVVAGRASVAA